MGGKKEKKANVNFIFRRRCIYFRPFTIDESLKALLPLMTMVNELQSNHSDPTKHRRKPNGTLSHNTLIRAHLQSALQPLQLFSVVLTSDARKLKEILTTRVICSYFHNMRIIHSIATSGCNTQKQLSSITHTSLLQDNNAYTHIQCYLISNLRL